MIYNIPDEKIINWNIDKNYLVELSKGGHKVVATYVEDDFRPEILAGYFEAHGTLVLKPRIGAGGRATFKVSPEDGPSADALNNKLFEQSALGDGRVWSSAGLHGGRGLRSAEARVMRASTVCETRAR